VFLTGHTGFKGAWLSLWLERLGATIFGYALAPDQTPSLFTEAGKIGRLASTLADLSDRAALAAAVAAARPTVAIHMAAQPLVRRSYLEPAKTFAANVMGTVHVLEALRDQAGLRAVLVVTTDKVYANVGEARAFVESDPLGGEDPYSASKAAADLATAAWGASFFTDRGVPVATARAGNVVGGGDWSADRIAPDVWRAARAGAAVELRHPDAIRPWQHVLDCLAGYLAFLERMVREPAGAPAALNFGPPAEARPLTVGELATLLGDELGTVRAWVPATSPGPQERAALALDAGAAQRLLGWRPRLTTRDAIGWTADWYRRFDAGEAAAGLCRTQIEAWTALA
jgi:CDP-glucose 4,6-dehydratase